MTEPIRAVPLPDIIAQRIQTLILEGVLRPGERLLPERELADKLGVSRPSLRQALASLEAKGLLASGKSGTAVARFLDPVVDPLVGLLAEDERANADYFEYRLAIEAYATRMAAVRATEPDRLAIRKCLDDMKGAHGVGDATAEAQLDVALHAHIYEAAHNVLLLHIMRLLRDLMQRGVFYNRDQVSRIPGVRDAWLDQHLAIGAAVIAGDARAAEQAAATHVKFTFEAVEKARSEETRLAASLRRIDRRDVVAGAGTE
jgi:GntR family transcriptional repressor for pyruvate dehydrogenase complex